jgi:thioesterase domain-containing protein
MAALLHSRDNLLNGSRLVAIQPNGTKPPLFLCGAGDIGMYYSLIPYLGNDQPIYGLMTIVAYYPRVEDVARHYLSFVRETQVKGPYYLGGFSFGGLVAFEIAQQLHAEGEKVALIALMDSPGPAAYRLKTPVRRALGHASNLLRYGYPYLRAKIENQLRRLKRERSNRKRASYERKPYAGRAQGNGTRYERKPYAGRLTLFVAQGNGISNTMFDPALGIISPSLGWESVAASGVERYELSGGHVDILQEPFVRALGERLRQCLDREQLASAGCI